LWVALVLLASAGACVPKPLAFTCAQDGDCGAGATCRAGTCASTTPGPGSDGGVTPDAGVVVDGGSGGTQLTGAIDGAAANVSDGALHLQLGLGASAPRTVRGGSLHLTLDPPRSSAP
jgi:hypothetical protein